MNIVDPILFQCKLNPQTTAIHVPGVGSVTYADLEKFIYNVARNAAKWGIGPRAVVALYVADVIPHAALLFGLMHLGAVPLSLRTASVPEGIKPDFILTTFPDQFAEPSTVLRVDHTWLAGDGHPAPPAPIHENDLCQIILTSGSTGVAKGVAFSHAMIANRILTYTYSKGPRFAHCSRFFCDMALSTTPGFQYTMSLLGRGGTIYFLGPEPADMLQTINLHKIQGMATSPYGLGEFVKFFEADSAFDVSFDFIICQGAKLSHELSLRARVRMCQNLYSSYGSTETLTVAFGPASVTERVPGAVGYIQPGVTVEAVDQAGHALPTLQDGELRIRSKHLADGYVGDPTSTKRYFRDGHFYSGDIGHITPDGLLVISGRAKSALNIGGDTISPERVEDVIVSFAGINEAGVFALDNTLGIAELHALIVASTPIDEATLRAHCASRLPPACVPVRYTLVGSLPRGGQGKLERHRLPEIAATSAPKP